jgi:hypothetical protein
VARVSHWVISFDLEEWKKPRLVVHAAFTSETNANAYRDKLNEDLLEDEEHAVVYSQYNSFLNADFIKNKTCFRVEMIQDEKAHINEHKVQVSQCPLINAEATIAREDIEGRDGAQTVVWVGWATDNWDAIKKAKVRALATRMGP